MGLFKVSLQDFYICDRGFPHIKRERFDQFTANVLDLGDLTTPTRDVDAIAAIFDLAGFTKFCTQIDPQLAISEYLAAFLDWLFATVKRESLVDESDLASGTTPKRKRKAGARTALKDDGSIPTFAMLPFFAKFMGDGMLFLWNTSGLTEQTICSVPAILMQVCASYELEFLPKIAFTVADPPEMLRCGIARGKVFSVGNGNDFVGPCINMASRLQKLGAMQIAFSRRGFNADKFMDAHMRGHFVLKMAPIREIGENELVYIDKDHFDNLPDGEKALFEEPDENWRLPSEEELETLEKK